MLKYLYHHLYLILLTFYSLFNAANRVIENGPRQVRNTFLVLLTNKTIQYYLTTA